MYSSFRIVSSIVAKFCEFYGAKGNGSSLGTLKVRSDDDCYRQCCSKYSGF